jgi:hypothetical protein
MTIRAPLFDLISVERQPESASKAGLEFGTEPAAISIGPVP